MAIRLPPMQALRAFEAAAREKSLTRAAEALYVTHGAISHQIKSLEADLGVRLTERAGRGIRLTDEGERFASRVRSAFAELRPRFRRSPACQPAPVAGQRPAVVRRPLAATADRALCRGESGYRPRHAVQHVERRFRSRRCRCGDPLWAGHWPGVTAEHLLDDRFFPVCSPRILAGGRRKRPKISRATRCCARTTSRGSPGSRPPVSIGPNRSRGPTFGDSSHMLQAAAEGQGVALARARSSARTSATACSCGRLKSRRRRREILARLPATDEGSPKLASFRRWLHDEIAAEGHESPRGARRTVGRRAPAATRPEAVVAERSPSDLDVLGRGRSARDGERPQATRIHTVS